LAGGPEIRFSDSEYPRAGSLDQLPPVFVAQLIAGMHAIRRGQAVIRTSLEATLTGCFGTLSRLNRGRASGCKTMALPARSGPSPQSDIKEYCSPCRLAPSPFVFQTCIECDNRQLGGHDAMAAANRGV
jgi:hypothetical protein